MESYPTKFKSFQRKIVQMGALQKWQNSIKTVLWPVYPIHTNSQFWVIFEKPPFCPFPPPNTSIRGKDSNLIDLSFEYLSFSNKRKTAILFPSPLTFLEWPMVNLLLSTLVTFNYNRCYVLCSCFLAFYVSFVVTPLCSNASELVSSLIFAAKKKKENISMTFAQVIILSQIREVNKN